MSSTALTLSDDELFELTKRRRADARRRALEAMGIPYRVRHDGTLAVIRAHAERDPSTGTATIATREPQLHL